MQFLHGWFIMFVKVMGSAQTEDVCGSELAHRIIHSDGYVGRMPANECTAITDKRIKGISHGKKS